MTEILNSGAGNTLMCHNEETYDTLCALSQIKQKLAYEYMLYTQGVIDQDEYCCRVKPIDREIDRLEMSILQGTLDWKEAFLPHTPKPEH